MSITFVYYARFEIDPNDVRTNFCNTIQSIKLSEPTRQFFQKLTSI